MFSTTTVTLGERLQRGLIAALLWTPVLAPILYLLNNSLIAWLGFGPYSLFRATVVTAVIVFTNHAMTAERFTLEADNRVDRIVHDPALGFLAKLAAVSRDRLGGALVLYIPIFVAILVFTRF
jgi:hypothetical protein